MDLHEEMTLQTAQGPITLPVINFLRLTIFKLHPLMIKYQQETQKSDIFGFLEWTKETLGMKGKNVLL